MSRHIETLIAVLLREWLFFAAFVGMVAVSLYFKKLPAYSLNDFQVLFLLFVLFIIVNGLERTNVFLKAATVIEKGRFVPLKLILLTAVLSAIVTNDVALLIIVPLTMKMEIRPKAGLVILEAMAANAGSALLPFGNPQNLFIYWFYHINIIYFVKTIYFLSFVSIGAIVLLLLLMNFRCDKVAFISDIKIKKGCWVYLICLAILILIIIHILPIYIGVIPILYAFVFDRKSLQVDYLLLATFFCFFGFTDNLRGILQYTIEKGGDVFLFSAIVSQFIGNVSSVLLFSDFTHNWKALLWGVNVGGFGNLMGSFANLIVYRIYTKDLSSSEIKNFLIRFHLIGYYLFAVGVSSFFLMDWM